MTTQMKMINAESCDDLQDRVFRLRHEVYLREMKLPLQDEFGGLRDEFDNYSTNFLLSQESEDIGTLRMTSAEDGELEIGDQSPEWKAQVDDILENDTTRVIELTRLMVHRQHRGSDAVARLFRSALDQSVGDDVDVVLLAGKVGVFARFYSMFGAEIIDPTPVEYVIDGHVLGKYYLMKLDLRVARAKLTAKLWTIIDKPEVASYLDQAA